MADVFDRRTRSWVMGRVRSADTAPERRVRRWLHAQGFRFRLHRKDLPGKPDIVLPGLRSVVFVHGCFWHGHPGCPRSRLPASNKAYWMRKIEGNVARDKRTARKLRRGGWHVFTVWECMLSNEIKMKQRLLRPLSHLKQECLL